MQSCVSRTLAFFLREIDIGPIFMRKRINLIVFLNGRKRANPSSSEHLTTYLIYCDLDSILQIPIKLVVRPAAQCCYDLAWNSSNYTSRKLHGLCSLLLQKLYYLLRFLFVSCSDRVWWKLKKMGLPKLL